MSAAISIRPRRDGVIRWLSGVFHDRLGARATGLLFTREDAVVHIDCPTRWVAWLVLRRMEGFAYEVESPRRITIRGFQGRALFCREAPHGTP